MSRVQDAAIPCDTLYCDNDFVNINICGMTYEVLRSTLERYPDTLLGNEMLRRQYFVQSRNAYFFDRNRQCFEAILFYYQSKGCLIRPVNIPMQSFSAEVIFFGLGEEVLQMLQANEGYIKEKIVYPENELQKKIWTMFEYSDSSLAARLIACWSVLVIVTSIVVFCLETMPEFRSKQNTNLNSTLDSNVAFESQDPHVYWFALELFCIIWFTIEYIIRLASSPNKWTFIKSFLNIIDLVSILPYYVSLVIDNKNMATLSFLRVVRLVRVFRIFKLSRHSIGLQILGETLKASISELGMLVFFLLLGVILFSSAIYYAEEGENNDFNSIPSAFWYSLVTMTTVGYGDMVPKTLLGKIIGSFCALSGVLTIALPVPVIVSNFEFFYKRDQLSEEKGPKGSAQGNVNFVQDTLL